MHVLIYILDTMYALFIHAPVNPTGRSLSIKDPRMSIPKAKNRPPNADKGSCNQNQGIITNHAARIIQLFNAKLKSR
jgi:hypothetical protein